MFNKKNVIGLMVGVIVALILLCIINYIVLVPKDASFISVYFFAIFIIAVFSMSCMPIFDSKLSIGGLCVCVSIILIVMGISICNSTIFNANEYRNLLGDVKVKEFAEEVSPIDLSQIPIVDRDLAINLADKKLGEQIAIGSQVSLGEPTLCNVAGKLYWVSPLEHSGIFKWNSNRSGTDGYIMVSATDIQDVQFIQEVNGSPIKLKYQMGAYFGDNIKRHIYKLGYDDVGLTDFSFELDDEMNPYWVVTKYCNTIGFSGEKILGVIIVDPKTGEAKDYTLENTPDWVDRIYPTSTINSQLNYWGKYVNGWKNSVFAKKGVLNTTEGMATIYNDGNCYYYTGITSAGSDESTVGFTLTNTKTKETTLYKVAGSTEIAGKQSAEGKVQEKGYEATFPILINVENVPTYFTTLKDKKGLIKMYAMVSVKDYSIVGVGETLKETKSSYMKYLRNSGANIVIEGSSDMSEISSSISRIGYTNTDGVTYYYITLKDLPNNIFIVPLTSSNELPLTQINDVVKVEYNLTESTLKDVISFDNLNI